MTGQGERSERMMALEIERVGWGRGSSWEGEQEWG